MSTVPLRRAGGSVTVTIPPLYLKQTGLAAGQIVDIEIKGSVLTIKPAARKRLSLAEIIKGTPKSVARARAEGWDELPPSGKRTVTPEVGDVLHLAFDPASGREMEGDHYCLVVTPKAFNGPFGLAWTLPITTGAQTAARSITAVTLMGTGLKVSGNVLCHQIKALDWSARKGKKVDRLTGPVLDQILDICTGIIDPARRG